MNKNVVLLEHKWYMVVVDVVFSSTGAIIRAVFTGVASALLTVAIEVILSANLFLMLLVSAMVRLLNILTTFINHVRMFNVVRAHRKQVLGVAVSNRQRAMILRREKKVAYHMIILTAAALICLVTPFLLKAFQSSFVQRYRYLFPWTMSFSLINASVNPIINFCWNKELRNAMKSMVSC